MPRFAIEWASPQDPSIRYLLNQKEDQLSRNTFKVSSGLTGQDITIERFCSCFLKQNVTLKLSAYGADKRLPTQNSSEEESRLFVQPAITPVTIRSYIKFQKHASLKWCGIKSWSGIVAYKRHKNLELITEMCEFILNSIDVNLEIIHGSSQAVVRKINQRYSSFTVKATHKQPQLIKPIC